MKEIIKKYIGLKVKVLREKRGLSQESLAELCEVSWRTISNLERGVVVPDLRVLISIAAHFGVGLDQFFEYQVQEHKETSRLLAEARLFDKIQSTDDKLFAYIQDEINIILKHFQ